MDQGAVRRMRDMQRAAFIFRERTARPPECAVSVPGRCLLLPHGRPGAAVLTFHSACESPDVWLQLGGSDALL